jgi:hypothetical protein
VEALALDAVPTDRAVQRALTALKLEVVGVAFEVGGRTYELSERQATILAENLRVLSKSELTPASEQAAVLTAEQDWRPAAQELADSIEAALVDGDERPLRLEGGAADATYCVLRLMAGMDSNGGGGLRDALGTPVESSWGLVRIGERPLRHLSRPELMELLIILFVLAVLTVFAGFAWTGTWWVLAPFIAALLGVRVATTRASGRFAWSVASVLWWAIFLVPAAVLVTLILLLVLAIAPR